MVFKMAIQIFYIRTLRYTAQVRKCDRGALYIMWSVMGKVRTHVSAMHVRIDGTALAQTRAAATAAHCAKDLVTLLIKNHSGASEVFFF